jgi:8-oxo-dGTP pyrophosphatase MutT (NUDIX family)
VEYSEKLSEQLAAIQRVLSEKKGKPIGGDQNLRRASVAIILRPSPNGFEILLVKRAKRADDPWSGQIAFPGGYQKEGDANPLSTAIREAKEEVGIDLRNSKVLGSLDETKPFTRPLIVTPFVILLEGEVSVKPGDEIERAFWVNLNFFTDENYIPNARVHVRGNDIVVSAYVFKENIIWGLTERMITKFRRSLNSPKTKQ